jgi:hypothetical protein
VVLLLYCIRLPRAANAGTSIASTGLEWRGWRPPGGPRSATAWSPRSLRERVRPDVRLETPPRISAGRATASGHRAVLKHEAIWVGDGSGPSGEDQDEEEGSHQHDDVARHMPSPGQGGVGAEDEIDIVPTVEANGNKPISPLSVAAEPHCLSIKELQLGRRVSQ